MTKNAKQSVDIADTFTKQELIESAAELNTTPEFMAGALVSVHKEQITKAEAEKAVEAYKNRIIGDTGRSK